MEAPPNAHNAQPNDKVWTIEQLAERLSVHPATLARWRSEGTGPDYIKVGRTILYPESAIQDWLKRNTYSATNQYMRFSGFVGCYG